MAETDADLAGIEAALAEAIASEPVAKKSKPSNDSAASATQRGSKRQQAEVMYTYLGHFSVAPTPTRRVSVA